MVASEIGSQPLSRSAFVVSHHLDGLLLLDLLRICVGVPVLGFVAFHAALYRNPRHGVLPFEALIPVCSGPCRMANHASVGFTSPVGSPRRFTVNLAPSSLFLPRDVYIPALSAPRAVVLCQLDDPCTCVQQPRHSHFPPARST